MNIRYDMIGAMKLGEERHPQEVIAELGIGYERTQVMPIADCWVFEDCVRVPDRLPGYLIAVEDAVVAMSGEQSISITLLPCPFCGVGDMTIDATECDTEFGKQFYEVVCGGCDIAGPGGFSAFEAARRWNKRREPKKGEVNRRKVKNMILFINGSITAFDEAGEQIPELQMNSAVELWAMYAEATGFDVDGCKFKTAVDEIHGTIETCFDGPVERFDCTPLDHNRENVNNGLSDKAATDSRRTI